MQALPFQILRGCAHLDIPQGGRGSRGEGSPPLPK